MPTTKRIRSSEPTPSATAWRTRRSARRAPAAAAPPVRRGGRARRWTACGAGPAGSRVWARHPRRRTTNGSLLAGPERRSMTAPVRPAVASSPSRRRSCRARQDARRRAERGSRWRPPTSRPQRAQRPAGGGARPRALPPRAAPRAPAASASSGSRTTSGSTATVAVKRIAVRRPRPRRAPSARRSPPPAWRTRGSSRSTRPAATTTRSTSSPSSCAGRTLAELIADGELSDRDVLRDRRRAVRRARPRARARRRAPRRQAGQRASCPSAAQRRPASPSSPTSASRAWRATTR